MTAMTCSGRNIRRMNWKLYFMEYTYFLNVFSVISETYKLKCLHNAPILYKEHTVTAKLHYCLHSFQFHMFVMYQHLHRWMNEYHRSWVNHSLSNGGSTPHPLAIVSLISGTSQVWLKNSGGVWYSETSNSEQRLDMGKPAFIVCSICNSKKLQKSYLGSWNTIKKVLIILFNHNYELFHEENRSLVNYCKNWRIMETQLLYLTLQI
jgi:hypothetical protein